MSVFIAVVNQQYFIGKHFLFKSQQPFDFGGHDFRVDRFYDVIPNAEIHGFDYSFLVVFGGDQ